MSKLSLSVEKASKEVSHRPENVVEARTEIRVPDQLADVDSSLNALGGAINAGGWATAAVVYAWTEEGKPGPRSDEKSSDLLSISDFARRKIRGLSTRDSVRTYREAWKAAIVRGWVVAVGPGDLVSLPTQDFKLPKITAIRDRDARQVEAGTDVERLIVSDRAEIWIGDFAAVMAGSEWESRIDLILTDPPYPAEFAEVWTALAEVATHALRSGGIVAALSGKIELVDHMTRLGEHLDYGWMYAEQLTQSNTRILARHVLQEWKPWLCYSNGAWPSGIIDWHGDLIDPAPRQKDRYHWQQSVGPALFLASRLAPADGLIVDPFCGSGSYGEAALAAGRRFIGIELDRSRAIEAHQRLVDFVGVAA